MGVLILIPFNGIAKPIPLFSLVAGEDDFESLTGEFEFSDFGVELEGSSMLSEYWVIPLSDGFRVESSAEGFLDPGKLSLRFEVEAESNHGSEAEDDEEEIEFLSLSAIGFSSTSVFSFSASAWGEDDEGLHLGSVEIGTAAPLDTLHGSVRLWPPQEEILIWSELISESGIGGSTGGVEYHFDSGPSTIPEPGTAILIGIGLACLTFRRARLEKQILIPEKNRSPRG